jgi:DNA helicase-2/ATP-dependent DNA helicase PcrA
MDAAGPDDLLAGLDDAQREAVTTTALPLCVLAGAGSGKTRVLTRRIAWRCATGLDDPRRVLALTFTRAAAAELGARLRALGLRDGVRAGTFHAVAWRELRARALDAGRTPPVLLDRPARLLRRTTDLDPTAVAALAGELAWTRARGIALDRYPAEARRTERSADVAPEQVVELGHAYEREKRRRGLVDFDDLLEHLAADLVEDPAYAAALRWRFTHLYVDELQDLNPLQHRLLEAWRGGRPGLTAVGDPNQAIYGWNGSDPAFIERFADIYPGATVVAIGRNYRSVTPVLDLANALLDAGGLGGVRLEGVRGEGDAPRVEGYENDEDELVALARAVHDAHVPGTAWSHQAVLARTNALLGPVEAALRAAGVPVRVRGRAAFRDHPEVRAVLRELTDPRASLTDLVARLGVDGDGDGDGDGVDHAGLDAPGAGGDGGSVAVRARLLALAERYLAEHHTVDGRGFRGWLLSEVDDLPGGDAVEVTTFHGAKGREWPTVHVVAVEDGFVPVAGARSAAARVEERRLFYVACTRAEQRLRISWAARRSLAGGSPVARRPSPFLEDVAAVLERQRRAATPVRPPAVPRPHAPSGPLDPAPQRLDALRRWRATRARAAGIAPAALVPDAVLARVAQAAPSDAEALASIPGTGSLLLAGFADELLDSLRG